MQHLHCILNILFNNDKLTPLDKTNQDTSNDRNKMPPIRICCQTRILKLCSHKQKVTKSVFQIHVQLSNQCSKYFKIFLVYKS